MRKGKNRGAAKKAPEKQVRQVGVASDESAEGTIPHHAPVERVVRHLPEAFPPQPSAQEAVAAQGQHQGTFPVASPQQQAAGGRGYTSAYHSHGRSYDHSRGHSRGRSGDFRHSRGDRRQFYHQQQAVQQEAASQPGGVTYEQGHQWQQPPQQYQYHPPTQQGRGRGRGRGRGAPQPTSSPGDTFQTLSAPAVRESPHAASSVQQLEPLPAQKVQPRGPYPQKQQRPPPPAQQMMPIEPSPQQQQRPSPEKQTDYRGAHQQSPRQQQPQVQKDDGIAQKMKNLSLDTLNIPVRPDIHKGGTMGRPTEVDTNHLKLDLSKLKNTTLIHYDVMIKPDHPKRLFRKVIKAFKQVYFPDKNPVFDGRKNMVALSYLPRLGPGEELTAKIRIQDAEKATEKAAEREFEVKVKPVDEVDLTCLHSYMGEETNLELPQKAIQMLDIVIRNAPAQRFVQVGRSFFTPPARVYQLGNGMHMWLGFYQSVTLGWKPFLNVDVAHKGFPGPKNVRDIMDEVLESRFNPFNPHRELNPGQHEDLTNFLKGLKVEYKLPNQNTSKRIYRVNGAVLSARKQNFKLPDGSSTTVAQYFQREKNYKLEFPDLPCLHVGAQNRATPIYLPVELCTILPGQVTFRKMNEQQTSAMIKFAATSTDERRQKIENAIRQANYNKDPSIEEFGISISSQFERVNARILGAPQITYANQIKVQPAGGKWSVKPFLKSCQLQNWVIINCGTRASRDDLWRFAEQMSSVGNSLGMTISEPRDVIELGRGFRLPELYGVLQDWKNLGTQLAVVVIYDNRTLYAQVKQSAELKVGLLTQCLKDKTVSRCNYNTVQNILLKINSKLNGVNHKLAQFVRPPCLQTPAMIIGADVTHPSPDQRNIPSVAAVCASHDPDAFQYNLQFRLQPPRQEIIQDLKEIMIEQLIFFFKKTNCKPRRLIFYRDGVSEGQFAMVLREELKQIKDACRHLEELYEPQVTFLVVQKRHHTRFFPTRPEDQDGKNKNVPAGTIVDTEITHPRHIDFYLVSHASIQGVSRPTKYRTLWDDSDMNIDELEQLTYYLCHLFSRCTRSVSYPAPTYYAHLAAYRARMYIEGQRINLDRLIDEQALRNIKDDIIKGYPMFFV